MSNFNDNFSDATPPDTDRISLGIVLLNDNGDVLVVQRAQDEELWQMPEFPIEKETDIHVAAQNAVSFLCPSAKAMIVEEADDWFEETIPDYIAKKEGLTGSSTGQQKWFALKLISAVEKFDLSNDQTYAQWKWTKLSDIPSLVAPYKRVTYKTLSELFKQHSEQSASQNLKEDFKSEISSLADAVPQNTRQKEKN